MASPRPQQRRPRSRLGVAILAGGIALVIVLVAVSGVIVMGADDGDSDAPAPTASDDRPREPREDPADPPPDGPPATVELRPVLALVDEAVDCRAAGVWCAEQRGFGAYRLGPAELRTTDIVSAEARISDYGGYVVGITLSDAGAEKFERVTTELSENTGVRAQLAIVVDGRVVSAPEVQGPIPGGEIDIAADFTQAEAERLAAAVDP